MDGKQSMEPDKGLLNKKRKKLLWQIPLLLALVVVLVPLVSNAITGNYNPLSEVVFPPWKKTPKVYEFTVNEVPRIVLGTPVLEFQCKVGERVDGEVNTSQDSVVTYITDPYGNTIVKSATEQNLYRSTQKYPLKFAFFAAIDGEYVINIWAPGESTPFSGPATEYFNKKFTSTHTQPTVNIKVTVYGK